MKLSSGAVWTKELHGHFWMANVFMDTALIEEKSIIVANVLDELLFKDRSGLLSEFWFI